MLSTKWVHYRKHVCLPGHRCLVQSEYVIESMSVCRDIDAATSLLQMQWFIRHVPTAQCRCGQTCRPWHIDNATVLHNQCKRSPMFRSAHSLQYHMLSFFTVGIIYEDTINTDAIIPPHSYMLCPNITHYNITCEPVAACTHWVSGILTYTARLAINALPGWPAGSTGQVLRVLHAGGVSCTRIIAWRHYHSLPLILLLTIHS